MADGPPFDRRPAGCQGRGALVGNGQLRKNCEEVGTIRHPLAEEPCIATRALPRNQSRHHNLPEAECLQELGGKEKEEDSVLRAVILLPFTLFDTLADLP